MSPEQRKKIREEEHWNRNGASSSQAFQKMLKTLSAKYGKVRQEPFKWLLNLKKMRYAKDAPNTSAERFFKTLPENRFYGLQRAKIPSAISSEQTLRYHKRADWTHCHPEIMVFAANLIEQLRRQEVPMYVHSAFRDKKTQNDNYRKGVSTVTWPRASHCQGKAVDIVHAAYHWELSEQEWSVIGKLGKEVAHRLGVSITWGGDWTRPYDPAHWQLKSWDSEIQELHPLSEPLHYTPRYILRHKQIPNATDRQKRT